MNNIIRLLPKLLDAAGENQELAESAAQVAWNRGVGEGLRANALPVRLYQNTLVVAVADALWQKQLQTMSAELLARVNWILGRDLIKFIEFRVDAKFFETKREREAQLNKTESVERAMSLLPIETMTAAETIQDESLRQHFLLAAAAAAMRRQTKGDSQSQI